MNLENVIWANQTYKASHKFKNLSPILQIRTHFTQNNEVNLIHLLNIIIYLGVWILKTKNSCANKA